MYQWPEGEVGRTDAPAVTLPGCFLTVAVSWMQKQRDLPNSSAGPSRGRDLRSLSGGGTCGRSRAPAGINLALILRAPDGVVADLVVQVKARLPPGGVAALAVEGSETSGERSAEWSALGKGMEVRWVAGALEHRRAGEWDCRLQKVSLSNTFGIQSERARLPWGRSAIRSEFKGPGSLSDRPSKRYDPVWSSAAPSPSTWTTSRPPVA